MKTEMLVLHCLSGDIDAYLLMAAWIDTHLNESQIFTTISCDDHMHMHERCVTFVRELGLFTTDGSPKGLVWILTDKGEQLCREQSLDVRAALLYDNWKNDRG